VTQAWEAFVDCRCCGGRSCHDRACGEDFYSGGRHGVGIFATLVRDAEEWADLAEREA
jgi:hypothetical protein